MAIFKSVNDKGLKEIERILNCYHRLANEHGDGYFTYVQLCAWADGVDFQLSEGNAPTLDISASESVTGSAISYELSTEFIDEDEGLE